MAKTDSMSLEETNKVRLSLGLAPLAADDGDEAEGQQEEVEEDQDTIAEANWEQKRNEERRAREEKEAKERLARAKNQRELRARLQGKGLGEAEVEAAVAAGSSSNTAADWIKKSRKAAKARAAELEKLKQREKELEERDRDALYGETDLEGLRVTHGVDDFEEGKDVVLTLKDSKVLGEDDDELQNVNLAEYERTAKRLDLKKRGKDAYKYTGLDDEEFDPANLGKAKGVLSKYDEVFDEDDPLHSKNASRQDGGFRLGGAVPAASTSSASTSAAGGSNGGPLSHEEKQKQIRRELLSLDYTKQEQTDYLQEGDVGFKKPKKKKKKSEKASSSRRMPTFDDEAEAPVNGHANGDVDMTGVEEEEIDTKPKIPTAERRLAKEGNLADGGVIDDDDMQAALARQRRAANKKRMKAMRGEDLAKQMMEERAVAAPAGDAVKREDEDGADIMADDLPDAPANGIKKEEDAKDDDAEGGLVLDDTSEFIRNISARSAVERRQPVARATGSATPLPRIKTEPRDADDVPLDEMDVKVEEEPEEGEAGEFDEDEEYGMRLDRETSTLSDQGGLRPPEADSSRTSRSPGAPADDKDDFATTSNERTHSRGGLADTLAMVRTTGALKPLTPEEQQREKAYKDRERFVNELHKAEQEAEAERLRNRASGQNKDQAQREYENKQRAHAQAQRQVEAFKNYKPNVEISYTDEFGRDLTPKEAWKHLSHKFHGKGSGTMKREKLLKQIEDERKRAAMASGDTPLNTNAAFQERQKRMGSATMVLGVGNRNTAPSADTLLGSSAGKAALDVAKGKGAQAAAATGKRKRTEPKVLG